jgi:hypothetical protein
MDRSSYSKRAFLIFEPKPARDCLASYPRGVPCQYSSGSEDEGEDDDEGLRSGP